VLPIIEQLYSTLTQRPLKVMRPVEEPEVIPSFAAPTAHMSIVRRLNAPDMRQNKDTATAEARAREALENHNRRAHEQSQQLRMTMTLASARAQYAMHAAQRSAGSGQGEDPELSGDQTIRFERVQVKQVVEEQLKTSPGPGQSEQKSIGTESGSSTGVVSASHPVDSYVSSSTAPKWGDLVQPSRGAAFGVSMSSTLSPGQLRAGVIGTLGAVFAASQHLTKALLVASDAALGSLATRLMQSDIIAARNYFADATAHVPNSGAPGARVASVQQVVEYGVIWGNFEAQDKVVSAVIEALSTKSIPEDHIAELFAYFITGASAGQSQVNVGGSLVELAVSSPLQFWALLGFYLSVIGACASDFKSSPASCAAVRLVSILVSAAKARVGVAGLNELVADYGIAKICSSAVTAPAATSALAAVLLSLYPSRITLATQLAQQLRTSTATGLAATQIVSGTAGLAPEVVASIIDASVVLDPTSIAAESCESYVSVAEACSDSIVSEVSTLRSACQEGKMSEDELVLQLEARIGGLAAAINAFASILLRLPVNSKPGIALRIVEAIDRCSVLAEELVGDTFDAYSGGMEDLLPDAFYTADPKAEIPPPVARWIIAPHAFAKSVRTAGTPGQVPDRRSVALRDAVALAVSLVKFHAAALCRRELLGEAAIGIHVSAIDRMFALATVYGVPIIPAVGCVYLLAHPTLLVAFGIAQELVPPSTSSTTSAMPPAITELLLANYNTGATAASAISAHPLLALLVGLVSGSHGVFAKQSPVAYDDSVDLHSILPVEFTDESSERYLMTAASLSTHHFVDAVRVRLFGQKRTQLMEGGAIVPNLAEVIDVVSTLRFIASDCAKPEMLRSSLSRGQLQLAWTCLSQVADYPSPYGQTTTAVNVENASNIVAPLETLLPHIILSAESNPSSSRDALAVLGMIVLTPSLAKVTSNLLRKGSAGGSGFSVLAYRLASSKYCTSSAGAMCAKNIAEFFRALLRESQHKSDLRELLQEAASSAQSASSHITELLES